MTQEQTTGSLLRVGLEDRATLVKPGEMSGKLIKIIAQKIYTVFLGRVGQVRKPNRFACSSFERLAIFSEDGAKPHVGQLDALFGMPAAKDREELLEMQLLWPASHINDLVWMPGFEPMCECGKVG